MLEDAFDWLEADPLRWHVANAIQITLILGLSGPIRSAIATVVLAGLALWSLANGLRGLRAVGSLHPFHIALAFGPQAFGLGLAGAAINLSAVESVLVPALAFFCLQVVWVIWWNERVAAGQALFARVPRWTEVQ